MVIALIYIILKAEKINPPLSSTLAYVSGNYNVIWSIKENNFILFNKNHDQNSNFEELFLQK